jgi:outer membrane lipoprotein-sorting protein
VDHKTGQKIRIMDGLIISIEMPENHEQRYSIEGPDTYQGSDGVTTSTTQPNVSTTGNKVWAYAPDRSTVVVSSSDLIKSATLYDITGRLITQSPIANSQSPNNLITNSLTLHTAGVAGVYIVDVTLRDGSTEQAQVIIP